MSGQFPSEQGFYDTGYSWDQQQQQQYDMGGADPFAAGADQGFASFDYSQPGEQKQHVFL